MKLNILNRIKISQKLFIAPIALVIALLILSFIAIDTFGRLADSSEELRDVNFKKIAIATDADQAVTNTHFDMYQLFALYALSAAEQERIQELIDDAHHNLKVLEENLALFEGMDLHEEERSIVEKAKEETVRYKKAINDVLDMIGIDVTMAYMYQNEMNMAYDDLKTGLENLKADVGHEVTNAFDENVESAYKAKADFIMVMIIAVMAGLIITFIVARAVSSPVKKMTDAMRVLAGGNTDVEIPARENKDEIGDMAKAVEVFRDNAIRAKQLEEEQKAAEIKAAEEKRTMMKKLADDFESSVMSIVEGVSSASTELNSTANSMSSISENTTERASAVAAAAEEAASNVQTVAAAAEELSHSISEIARQVQEESEIAKGAVQEAEETTAFISSLAESTDKISEVVQLINDIADQTNLLALNATIEAARAGDAGKGFAVVANEVKNLAAQTGKATEAIADQIADVQTKTKDAVNAIGSISDVIRKIDEISATIASAVEQQGAATREISQNVEQTAQGTQEVSSNIAGVTQAANEAGAAASQVSSSSSGLAKNAVQLKEGVDAFIKKIRQS